MEKFKSTFNNRKILITGHTGFKGSWLSLWLQELGAEVVGIALADNNLKSHWMSLNLKINEYRFDIRDLKQLENVIANEKPEIVFHFAAQPLVRHSYIDPIETWSTNVQGTINILEACRWVSSIRAIIIVTTDKCYENKEWIWGYRENDRLGGYDPYSASKACAELAVNSYRNSFYNLKGSALIATARAGNVIGGGDWSEDRLIPDLVRSSMNGDSVEIRSPNSTRPWQHVLESLSGYLLLSQALFNGRTEFADAWNFGPDSNGTQSVSDVLSKLTEIWGGIRWHINSYHLHPHEAGLLKLDSTKARNVLQWTPVWDLEECLYQTVEWYRAFIENNNVISVEQLHYYIATAKINNISWAD